MVKQTKNAANKRRKINKNSHVKASLTYVASHRHTGRRLAHKHTSHGLLFLLLLVAGIIMFLSLAALDAHGITQNGQVNVNLTVPGPPPTQGAEITQPVDNTVFKEALIDVSGTCSDGTTVAIYNNGVPSSSTICTALNTFATTIQLSVGINTLQAQNYDVLNQPGPTTGQIQVRYQPDEPVGPVQPNEPGDITVGPALPDVIAPSPDENPCYEPSPPVATGELLLIVSCITRNLFIGERLNLSFEILNGIGPYALSVEWGDDSKSQLFSYEKSGRHTISHTYLIPRVKNLTLRLVDSTGKSYQVQTVVDVSDNGTTGLGGSNPIETGINNIAAIWLEASVPVYWAAVALFAGFWVGDIFNRVYGNKKSRRRHA